VIVLQYECIEEISEVDVTISYKDGIIFIEAKYLALALVSPKAAHGIV
jgi:hypothetical protein